MLSPRPFPRLAVVAALSTASLASPAGAHDLCLLPDTPGPGGGRTVGLTLHLGETFPGEALPWRGGAITEMFVTDVRGRLDLDPAGAPSEAGRVALRSPGTAVIALSTAAEYVERPAAEFEAYLKAEGHQGALRARAVSGRSGVAGRERSTSHLKLIVNAAGPQSSVALSRTGLPLEIVPERDLARLHPGDTLPVRVFYQGDPYVDGRVCAARQGGASAPGAYDWCASLDGAGRAAVPIAGPGWQLIRTARMIPLRDDPRADWHAFRAALTFMIEPAGAAPPAPSPPAQQPGAPSPQPQPTPERPAVPPSKGVER